MKRNLIVAVGRDLTQVVIPGFTDAFNVIASERLTVVPSKGSADPVVDMASTIARPAGAEAPVNAPYTEHYPPDTQAASLWLRNRQPARGAIERRSSTGSP
jgi:hypothetical protein